MTLTASTQSRARSVGQTTCPPIQLVAQPRAIDRQPYCQTDRLWELCDRMRQWMASSPAGMRETPIWGAYLDMVEQVERALTEAAAAPLSIPIEEATQFVPLTPAQLRHMCRRGRIPGLRKENGRWFIPTAWLASFASTVAEGEVSHAA